MEPTDIVAIVVHHTATSEYASLQDINAMHLKRGFSMIGYHHLIWPDGTSQAGRPLQLFGAHVKTSSAPGWNSRTWGFAFVGNYECSAPTDAAMKAASDLIMSLWRRTKRPVPVLGHREFESTACPGRWSVSERLWFPTMCRWVG